MPTLVVDQRAFDVRESNRRLRHWMNALVEGSQAQPRPAAPEQIEGLLSELMRVGEWLRDRPTETGPELEGELAEYRIQVERLRLLLPSIHAALLAERSRLEHERARLQVASEWVRRSRQTL
jgi:hypothetical protein